MHAARNWRNDRQDATHKAPANGCAAVALVALWLVPGLQPLHPSLMTMMHKRPTEHSAWSPRQGDLAGGRPGGAEWGLPACWARAALTINPTAQPYERALSDRHTPRHSSTTPQASGLPNHNITTPATQHASSLHCSSATPATGSRDATMESSSLNKVAMPSRTRRARS